MWTEREGLQLESGYPAICVIRKREILHHVLHFDKCKMSAVLWVQHLRTRKFLILAIDGAGISLSSSLPGLVFNAVVRFVSDRGRLGSVSGAGPFGWQGTFIQGVPAPAMGESWVPGAPRSEGRRSPFPQLACVSWLL